MYSNSMTCPIANFLCNRMPRCPNFCFNVNGMSFTAKIVMREMKEIIITPITMSVTVSNKFAEAMTKKNIHKKLLPAITPIANFVGVTWKRIKKDNNKKV